MRPHLPLLVQSLLLSLVFQPALSAAETVPGQAPPTPGAASKTPAPSSSDQGWALVAPRHSRETLLLDHTGKEVHIWTAPSAGTSSARLQPDGSILRLGHMPLPPPFDTTGLLGGRLQLIGWDDRVAWDFLDATSDHVAYGDAVMLPNGNVLTAVLEYKSRQECEALGRNPERLTDQGLFVPGLVEFQRNGKKTGLPVWKWSVSDHLFQTRTATLPHHHATASPPPGRVDINARPSGKSPVWMAPMEIDYHRQEDLVLMVMGGLGEVWVLDHSTTQAESASSEGGRRSRGGDALLRWRGPSAGPGIASKGGVISAEWRQRQDDDTNLTLVVLRTEGHPAARLVEEVTLDRQSLAVKRVTVLRKENPAPGAAPGEGNLMVKGPSAVSQDPLSKTLLLTDTLHGTVRQAGAGQPEWTHQNKRGQVTLYLRTAPASGEECCGNAGSAPAPATGPETSAPKMEEVKRTKFETAPVSKARLYGPGSLQKQP